VQRSNLATISDSELWPRDKFNSGMPSECRFALRTAMTLDVNGLVELADNLLKDLDDGYPKPPSELKPAALAPMVTGTAVAEDASTGLLNQLSPFDRRTLMDR
jgi:hypothetical protein